LTDIPLIENQADQSTTQVCCHAAATENEPEPSTSASTLASSTLQRETPRPSVNTKEVSDTLKILSPFPDASEKRMSVRKRRTQKSEILMSSLFKNELKEKTKDSRKLPKTTKKMLKAYRIRKILHLNHVLMIRKQTASFVENHLMRNGSSAIHVKTGLMRRVWI